MKKALTIAVLGFLLANWNNGTSQSIDLRFLALPQ
jgi:hypothetical protein